MATSLHNLSQYDITTIPDASNMCFGIVVAEWNEEITGALLDGAVKTLEKHDAESAPHALLLHLQRRVAHPIYLGESFLIL